MILQSIRFQIVLWYMLILSVTLSIFALVLFNNFKKEINNDLDDLLSSRAASIKESIDTYWQTEHLRTNKDIPLDRFQKQDNSNFIKIAQRWVEQKNVDPAFISFFVRIINAQGMLVAATQNMPNEMISHGLLKDTYTGKSRFDKWKVELSPGIFSTLRMLTTPVIERNRLIYVVQVASPLTSTDNAIDNLSFLLFVLLPMTVVLTGFAGAFLAKVALNPVHEMIKTINLIKAENLKLRLTLPRSKDEIHELAVTFNEMLNRLEDSFTTQRQFMQDISHELKTPLAILKGELEVTLKRIRTSDEYATVLESSLEEVNRIARMVENLLTLARFDTKTITLELENIELEDFIEKIVEDIRGLALIKNISIITNIPEGAILKADRVQIRRLLLNLLDNAIKYTPIKGVIEVKISSEKEFVTIVVNDNGIGIPSEELPHIFDRFYRVEKSRQGSGYGLGLSISKSIVEAHKGSISSQMSSNNGTSFIVSLPRIDS